MTRLLRLSLFGLIIVLPFLPRARPWPHFHSQDRTVQPYVNEFKELAKVRGIEFGRDPSIGFEALKAGNVVGVCYKWSIGLREVVFDQKYWKKTTPMQRRMLAFHELTHCYCGRPHDSRVATDGCPVSLMMAMIPNDYCARRHEQYYVWEMFNGCKPYK